MDERVYILPTRARRNDDDDDDDDGEIWPKCIFHVTPHVIAESAVKICTMNPPLKALPNTPFSSGKALWLHRLTCRISAESGCFLLRVMRVQCFWNSLLKSIPVRRNFLAWFLLQMSQHLFDVIITELLENSARKRMWKTSWTLWPPLKLVRQTSYQSFKSTTNRTC